jgi:TPP-dependent pyruvate/acetoin dehydrogenase alpha subunit
LTYNWATEQELADINKEIKAVVDEAVEFTKNSPWPVPSDVFADVVVKNEELVIRGTEGLHNGKGKYAF